MGFRTCNGKDQTDLASYRRYEQRLHKSRRAISTRAISTPTVRVRADIKQSLPGHHLPRCSEPQGDDRFGRVRACAADLFDDSHTMSLPPKVKSPQPDPVVVYLVDDDRDQVAVLSQVCEELGMAYQSFTSAEQFLANFDPSRPSYLMPNLQLPGMSGLDLQKRLDDKGVRIPILFLTAYKGTATIVQAMKRGTVAFLEKPLRRDRIRHQIADVLALEEKRRLYRNRQNACARRLLTLSPGEHRVMNLVVAGKPNKVIANELCVSERTVESRRAGVMRKLKVRSLAELVRVVVEMEHADSPRWQS